MGDSSIIDRMARQIEAIHKQTGELPAELRISKAQARELHIAAGLEVPQSYEGREFRFWNVPLVIDNDFFEAVHGTQTH